MFGRSVRMAALCLSAGFIWAQDAAPAAAPDPIAAMVGRLDLETYKPTIKGLTQFGDRRQGSDRNRAAIDWIENKLKSYGCTNTERIHCEYQPPPVQNRGNRANADPTVGPGGSRRRGYRIVDSAKNDPLK